MIVNFYYPALFFKEVVQPYFGRAYEKLCPYYLTLMCQTFLEISYSSLCYKQHNEQPPFAQQCNSMTINLN